MLKTDLHIKLWKLCHSAYNLSLDELEGYANADA